MRILTLIVCVLALGLSAGCGASDSSELSPDVLRKRIKVQFTVQEGSETPQARALVRTFPNGSLVSCWSEDTLVCGAAVPTFPAGGLSFSRTLDYWTFYRAVFDAGGEQSDVEQVDPEEALAPSRRAS